MTVQALVDEIQLMFPQVDDATILQQLNNTHLQLCQDFRIRGGQETLSSFVSGTRTYTMPSTNGLVADVYSATYFSSASSSGYPLTPNTIRDLQNSNPGFSSGIYGNAAPTDYYTDGGAIGASAYVVGFFPTPDTTSSGGYPYCKFDVAYYETLVLSSPAAGVSSDVMPPATGGCLAWYYGTLRKLAERLNDARLAEFAAQERKERLALAKTFARAEDMRASNRSAGFLVSRRV